MSKIFASLLSIFLLVMIFTLTVSEYAGFIDDTSDTISKQAVRDFVATAASKGYVDNRDYLDFQEKLNSTGVLYDVELTHYKKKYQPNYTDPKNYYTFEETFNVYYDQYYSGEILNTLFPNNGTEQDADIRKYTLSSGDMFKVNIKARSEKLSQRILGAIFPTSALFSPYYYSERV